MRRLMNRAAVAQIREEMDATGTQRNARKALAKAALSRANLTPCGREEWSKELI
jgi:hypothetical protein